MAQGDSGMIQNMKPGLNSHICDALKKIKRHMPSGFNQKILSAGLDQGRNFSDKVFDMPGFVYHPECQGQIDFSDNVCQPDPVRAGAMGMNPVTDTCSGCPLLKDIQHFLLNIDSDHFSGFADHPGHAD